MEKEKVKAEETVNDVAENIDDVKAAETIYLDKSNSRVMPLGEDFLSLKFDGKTHERVVMSRAMPFSMPDSYIIVKDNENKEIGIIRELDDFPDEEKKLIQKHLATRYYCPKILEVTEVKDKFGFMYVTVKTDSGEKSFASSDLTKSIKRIVGDKYIIIDVEGNRFLIDDINKVKNNRKIIAYII